jgi:outer membrane protein assembly factor BamB
MTTVTKPINSQRLVTGVLNIVLLMASVVTASANENEDVLARSGVTGGLIVCIGADDPQFIAGLRAGDSYRVHALDQDGAKVAKAREWLQANGCYGPVSVTDFDGKRLPYSDNLVDLLIIHDRATQIPDAEIMRVLAPLGVVMKGEQKTVKPWPDEIDEWTHYLHGPDNNAVSTDKTINLPRCLQWERAPRWGRSHEEFGQISSAVTAKGRLFYICDEAPAADVGFNPRWKVVACSAFNGITLWKRDISVWNDHLRHFRSGPSHLARRLVAVGDTVYVTLGLDAELTALDAVTGETRKTYSGTEWTEEIIFDNGILYLLVGSSETRRFGGGLSARNEPAMRKERFLVAIDATSGKELWRRNAKGDSFIMPLGVAVRGPKLYYHSVCELGCLVAATGKQLWAAPVTTPAKRYAWSTSTLVVTEKVVLLADRPAKVEAAKTDIEWGVHGWGLPKMARPLSAATVLKAYATQDGKQLWTAKCVESYNAPADVFAIDGLVWTGPLTKKVKSKGALDLMTGKVQRSIQMAADPVGMLHDRCYRNKATSGYIFTAKDGIEVIDLKKGWLRNNSWVRGPCQVGVMPANGLMYAPTHPCACHIRGRLQGYVALSSQRQVSVGKPITVEGRLLNGAATVASTATPGPEDWPMYRHDAARSGFTRTTIGAELRQLWRSDVLATPTEKNSARLTQPLLAYGKVFVASADRYAVNALDADSGKLLWRHTAGGSIDSAPTLYKGRVIFGSRDGSVYSLDAESGRLVWRFVAAPETRLIVSYGHIESAWPVHGAVLIQNDELYFTAGRSTYLGGGIRFFRLDPTTGKMLHSSTLSHIDPITEKQLGPKEAKFDSEGAVSDVMSGNGQAVFFNYMTLDRNGKEIAGARHLFSPTGLLDDEWFVRSYWVRAASMSGAGYSGWAIAANRSPAGRILCFDGERTYGYGRTHHIPKSVGHRGNNYHLFASSGKGGTAAPVPGAINLQDVKRKRGKVEKGFQLPNIPEKTFVWSVKSPLTVRAMVVTPDKLIVAGVPDVAQRALGEPHIVYFKNPEEALDAFEGRKGAFLQVISVADGSTVSQVKLPAEPVFDGMSAANNRLFLSLRNGAIVCIGGE